MIAVLCIGGSGGGGGGGGGGGTGGTTSFGSYMSALGGGGGQMATYGMAPQGGSTYDPAHVVAAGPSGGHGGNDAGCRNTSGTVNYGKGMKGSGDGGSGWYMTGGDGGVILGIMSVTPGQQIGVTIGAAGSPYYGTVSNPGALIVRY
ncbi:hypothetical protein H261_20999 [Paramagnetospirillum caucaseum]|uniref:Uncharacterized protein n=1 Tax=Paramagnetospirillum caucaseum TaxID=1244869 RepID=M2Z0W3_9PROT|nr:hypothetical protein [Paramagnetospirillum caucaseum]EME67920.1 hypothetical protein H261_20999 [Paramagnetospirillum caucaseum]